MDSRSHFVGMQLHRPHRAISNNCSVRLGALPGHLDRECLRLSNDGLFEKSVTEITLVHHEISSIIYCSLRTISASLDAARDCRNKDDDGSDRSRRQSEN